MSARAPHVQRALDAFDAFNRRDLEAFMRNVRADYEWRPFLTSGLEGAALYRGEQGMRAWFEAVDAAFEGFLAEFSDALDLGDRVVVLGALRGRGRGSGVPVESPLGIVVEVDAAGLGLRGRAFPSHADALAYARQIGP